MIHYFFVVFRHFKYLPESKWLVVLIFFISVVCYSTTGLMYFESETQPDLTWSDAIWWTFVTMTTVGYGDFFPKSTYGQFLVGLPTMLIGVSVLGYILSVLASILMETKLKEIKGMSKITKENHIIIFRFNCLLSTLKIVEEIRNDSFTRDTHIVIVDESLDELPLQLAKKNVSFVKGVLSLEETLEQANFKQAKHALIRSIENDPNNSDSKNLAIALTIEKIHPELITIVECVKPENITIFERTGCDSVICISELNYQMMVQEIQDPGIHSICSELTSNSHGKQFYLMPIPENITLYDDLLIYFKPLNELVIGIRRGAENLLFPDSNIPLHTSDKVVLIGPNRPVI